MSSFQHEFALSQHALRVRFGPGVRRDTGAEVERLDCSRVAMPGLTPRA
ncbi:hypothetical protein [uncultured Paracoccus sp.]|nr:hypothetical protein [uncultured Paracoccus sp.]